MIARTEGLSAYRTIPSSSSYFKRKTTNRHNTSIKENWLERKKRCGSV